MCCRCSLTPSPKPFPIHRRFPAFLMAPMFGWEMLKDLIKRNLHHFRSDRNPGEHYELFRMLKGLDPKMAFKIMEITPKSKSKLAFDLEGAI